MRSVHSWAMFNRARCQSCITDRTSEMKKLKGASDALKKNLDWKDQGHQIESWRGLQVTPNHITQRNNLLKIHTASLILSFSMPTRNIFISVFCVSYELYIKLQLKCISCTMRNASGFQSSFWYDQNWSGSHSRENYSKCK